MVSVRRGKYIKAKDWIEQLRKNGFSRQATLLESGAVNFYKDVLTQPAWFEQVVMQVWGSIEAYRTHTSFEEPLCHELKNGSRICLRSEYDYVRLHQSFVDTFFSPRKIFRPRRYKKAPLEVLVDQVFHPSMVAEAQKINDYVAHLLLHKAYDLVLSEARSLLAGDDDLKFKVYSGFHDYFPSSFEDWKDAIQKGLARYSRDCSILGSYIIDHDKKDDTGLITYLLTPKMMVADRLSREVSAIRSGMVSSQSSADSTLPQGRGYDAEFFKSALHLSEIADSDADRYQEALDNEVFSLVSLWYDLQDAQEYGRMIIEDARSIIADDDIARQRFDRCIEFRKHTLRKRTLKKAEDELDSSWYFSDDSGFSFKDTVKVCFAMDVSGEEAALDAFMKLPLS
ncbi:TPA: hypothetical protein HA265_01765, partial [Candidatus Woesearchaeota archaeon]|nr:hypothetical protein [Candidatus Woesearchaeota archaeon]